MKDKGLISLIIFCFCLVTLFTIPTFLFAETITIDITAEVSYVDDMENTLGGAITVGDIIKGQYTYESTTPDTNPLPTVGDYLHDTPPYGISLEVNGLIFKTDDSNVEFLVEIVNDHGIPPCDNYLLRSYNNLPLPGGIVVEHISWQLDDPTLTALSSEALPIDPPVLEDWQSIFGLSIGGFIPDPAFPGPPYESEYFIRAHVTSASIAPSEIIVTIDIKPGSFSNSINLKSKGKVPVAILSDATFDASTVIPNTVLFAGASPLSICKKPKDVNSDGLLDVVLHFSTQDLNLQPDDTEACLTGKTLGGQDVKGCDTVQCKYPCSSPHLIDTHRCKFLWDFPCPCGPMDSYRQPIYIRDYEIDDSGKSYALWYPGCNVFGWSGYGIDHFSEHCALWSSGYNAFWLEWLWNQ